ncbi:hypothetical protein ACFW1M_42350 [Streptomyces inhibens]
MSWWLVASAERFDRGTQADLLGWLTGRTVGAPLSTSRPGPVPTAPNWI